MQISSLWGQGETEIRHRRPTQLKEEKKSASALEQRCEGRVETQFNPETERQKVNVSRLFSKPSCLLSVREEAMRLDIQCKYRKLEVVDCFVN